MKCPKCGYVGFEETPRCRHCGYDFSFAAPVDAAAAVPVAAGAASSMPASAADEFFAGDGVETLPSLDRLGFVDLERLDDQPAGPLVDLPLATATPSDLFAESPPPARPPLAVRRASERPRSRPTTQVLRRPATSLLDVPVANDDTAADPIVAGPPQPASLAARLAAGLLDIGLLGGIALIVVYLTVRLAGLTMAELDVVPPLPLGAFLLGLAAAYLAAFTACGGQTLGKMAFGLRVVADDGAVPAGAAALRAVTALAGAALGGLGFVPALFDGDRRGLHDRLAGTRVVRL
jgi:uncharacterized RDD family membrane protein YckC